MGPHMQTGYLQKLLFGHTEQQTPPHPGVFLAHGLGTSCGSGRLIRLSEVPAWPGTCDLAHSPALLQQETAGHREDGGSQIIGFGSEILQSDTLFFLLGEEK